MYYVNGFLCQTEQARDSMIRWYLSQDKPVEIRPVPRDQHGRYIIPINDTMEQ